MLGVPLAVVTVAAYRRGNGKLELVISTAWIVILAVGLAAWDGLGQRGSLVWRIATYGGASCGAALASRAAIRCRRLAALRNNVPALTAIAVAIFACSGVLLFVLLAMLLT